MAKLDTILSNKPKTKVLTRLLRCEGLSVPLLLAKPKDQGRMQDIWKGGQFLCIKVLGFALLTLSHSQISHECLSETKLFHFHRIFKNVGGFKQNLF